MSTDSNNDREVFVPNTRALQILLCLGIAAFATLYCLSVSRYWKLSEDSLTYVLAGQSLASGNGYLEAGRTVFLYPPGTSAILALGWLVGRGSYFVLNAEVVAFAFASMVICYLLFRNSLGTLGAGIVVLLCLASTELFRWSTFLLSDIFYLFFSLLALWLYARDSTSGTGLSVLAACATRLIGVSLAAAILIDALRKRPKRWGVAAEMAGALGFVALWEMRNRSKGWSHTSLMFETDPWVPSHGHISPLGLIHRFVSNLSQFRLVLDLLTNGPIASVIAKVVIELVLALICALGFWELRKRSPVAALYCLLLALIVSVYHPWIEPRWLLPLLPFLFAALFLGVRSIAAKVGKPAYWAFALFALFYLAQGFRFQRHRLPLERATPFPGERVKFEDNYDLQKAAIWWAQHSSADDKFAADNRSLLLVMSGRDGISYPETDKANVFESTLARNHAFYVFVDPTSERDNRWPLAAIKKSSHFQLLLSAPQAQLYRFTPGS